MFFSPTSDPRGIMGRQVKVELQWLEVKARSPNIHTDKPVCVETFKNGQSCSHTVYMHQKPLILTKHVEFVHVFLKCS